MILDKERICPTLPHTRVAPEDEDEFWGRQSLPLAMPLDASRGRSPISQQFPLEKQETISTSRFHQWRDGPSADTGKNDPVQQLAAKQLQQHGTGKGRKGLPQSWPPERSFWAVWIKGG